MAKRVISAELYEAIADAQEATKRALDLAYKESTSYWLRTALGRAQTILIRWQVYYADRRRIFR